MSSDKSFPVILLGDGEMVATLVFEISARKERVRSSRTPSAN
jgi:hypothetical protein